MTYKNDEEKAMKPWHCIDHQVKCSQVSSLDVRHHSVQQKYTHLCITSHH